MVVADSSLHFAIVDNNKFSMLLDLEPQRVIYIRWSLYGDHCSCSFMVVLYLFVTNQ